MVTLMMKRKMIGSDEAKRDSNLNHLNGIFRAFVCGLLELICTINITPDVLLNFKTRIFQFYF